MVTRKRALLGLVPGLLLVAAWLLVPTVAVAGDPCYHGYAMPERTTVATTTVILEPCAFGPTNAQIPVGGTVTFDNRSDLAHLITGANQEWGSRDNELLPTAKSTYTFEKAGIYPYACALHRGMSGTIIVGDAATAGLAAPVGSTTVPPAGGDGTTPAILAVATLAAALIGGGLLLVAARRRAPVAVEPAAQPGTPEPAPR